MANETKYATIAEKFEAITKGKRSLPGMVWLTNDGMNANLDGNFVLVEVQAAQFDKEGSEFKAQGYTKYVHAKPVPEPTEAKQLPEHKEAKLVKQ